MALAAATARLLDPLDGLRRRWLRLLGPFARPLMIDRDLRVALMATLMMCTATLATLLFPLWLLALGPIVWGVPHLVADLRYLVVGPGFHRRRLLWLLGGLPIVATGFGADLSFGLLGTAAVALAARASLDRRLLALAAIGLLAAGVVAIGSLADLIFAHVHNFVAVALWWAWRPRTRRLHWLPLALFVGVSALLMTDAGLIAADSVGALDRELGGLGIGYQLSRLAPGVDADLGLRLVLLFCFTQAIHYAIWVHLLPDDDRQRDTPPTFRRSFCDLWRDVGGPVMIVAGGLSLLFAVWAIVDLMDATHGYFRLARFHGHLELAAATLLILEGRLPWSR
ncbi:MAG: hypothetical protein KC486_18870 [Myxococcales bacterium]|nr:hypothetical protein [Myxococcales bacterium]